jgi:hypothetical protein
MDDTKQGADLGTELEALLAEIKKERRSADISGKVLIEKADRLAAELEKTDFSDLDDAEKKAMQDLNTAIAEEIVSLKEEEVGI